MNYKRLVKELREKLIITQEELAQLLGVSFASINRWETGKHEPTTKIRRKIVQLCKENNIELIEEPIHITELKKMDAAFISGTSRRVLPVCCIDDLNFNSQHPLIPMLQRLFEDRVMQYINRKK